MERELERGEAGEEDRGEFAALRVATAARLGVRGDFIRVPRLATALAVSAASIHNHMRRGTFPIPHRKVGKASVVKLDDYVRWLHEAPARTCAMEAPPALAQMDESLLRAEAKARKQRFKREVREGLRRKGYDI